jgi:hypothetical protein
MQQNVARRPRFKRVSDSPPLRLTDRDKAILSAVLRYRFLTTGHILSLVAGSRQNITRRLQRLFHAGFLDRPRTQLPLRYAGELFEFVYSPTNKTAFPLVASSDGTASGNKECRAVTSLFLAHALSVSEALVSLESACRAQGVRFLSAQEILAPQDSTPAKHLYWQVTLKSDATTEKVGVIPDAVFAVERQDQSGRCRRFHYFLEADRGTMPLHRASLRLSSIRRKSLAYARTRRSGVLRERYGFPGFQVLFVTRCRERLERMKEVCQHATDGRDASLFLFVTLSELKQGDPLARLGMV